MTEYLGIYRGPDTRPQAVKDAADKIKPCYGPFDFIGPYCAECGECGIDIKHKPDCTVGKILTEWVEANREIERQSRAAAPQNRG